MRDSFIIYRSFYDAICDLPKENQAEVFMAICAYSLDKSEPELTGLSATIFKLIKPQLEANYKKYENGKKAKQKQNRSKTEAKDKQKESKTEANVNVNVNDNVNDNDLYKQKSFTKWTKNDFLNSVSESKEFYTKDMLNQFFLYWTEKSANGKMRFQLEKTWETSKRLITWKRNGEKFKTTDEQVIRGGSINSKAL